MVMTYRSPNRAGAWTAGLLLSLGASAAAPAAFADKLDFNFIQGDYILVDLDIDDRAVVGGDSVAINTNDDDGGMVSGAWQFFGHFYVYGEYSDASNDFEIAVTQGGVTDTVSGDLDVIRARAGVGYGWPLNDNWTMYSRLTWDHIKLDNIRAEGVDIGDTDDDGVGFEAGVRWLVYPELGLELQGYGRYSSVGDVRVDEGDFDDDYLVGVVGRWYLIDQLSLQMSYEFGDIKTFGGGLRFSF
jgi:hypothetical protein